MRTGSEALEESELPSRDALALKLSLPPENSSLENVNSDLDDSFSLGLEDEGPFAKNVLKTPTEPSLKFGGPAVDTDSPYEQSLDLLC